MQKTRAKARYRPVTGEVNARNRPKTREKVRYRPGKEVSLGLKMGKNPRESQMPNFALYRPVSGLGLTV